MKKATGKTLTRVLTVLGILLICGAVLTVVVSQVVQKKAAEKAEQIVSELRTLMPEIQNGVPDDRFHTAMPMLEIDGSNFAGIIEVPAYGTELPIYGTWDRGKVSQYPCRYFGSIYDGSLIIGGSDNAGQFDFMKIITGGDMICVTDVTGARYTYVVTDIEKTSDVTTENLTAGEADLVIFARNTYALDYTVVRCQWRNHS